MAMKPWLDCKTAVRLMNASHDRTLAPADRARMRLHTVICANCRRAAAQFDFLRRAMQRMGQLGEDTPPAEAKPPPGDKRNPG